jgi:hypothetical protein
MDVPGGPLEPARFYLERYTAAGIIRRDRIVLDLVSEIRARGGPEEVWIFTSGERYMDWSAPILAVAAPEYGRSVAPIELRRFGEDAGPDLVVPAGGRTVLLLHDDLGRSARPADRWRPAFRIDRDSAWAAEARAGEVVKIRRGGVEIAAGVYPP